jgi:hypothetical protein
MIKNKKAFSAALFYVGLGSLALLTMYPSDILSNESLKDFSPLLVLLTLPTNFISFGIRYSTPDSCVPVIITQLTFFVIWYKFLKSWFK